MEMRIPRRVWWFSASVLGTLDIFTSDAPEVDQMCLTSPAMSEEPLLTGMGAGIRDGSWSLVLPLPGLFQVHMTPGNITIGS